VLAEVATPMAYQSDEHLGQQQKRLRGHVDIYGGIKMNVHRNLFNSVDAHMVRFRMGAGIICSLPPAAHWEVEQLTALRIAPQSSRFGATKYLRRLT